MFRMESSKKHPTETEQPLRLLLAASTDATRKTILSVLENAEVGPYTLSHRQSLPEITTCLQAVETDLIIFDLDLAAGSGIEELQKILAMADTIPVIVLSGSEDRELSSTAIGLGAEDCLAKNNNFEVLLPHVVVTASRRRRGFHVKGTFDPVLRTALDSLSSRVAIIDCGGTTLFLNSAWMQTSPTGEEAAAAREGDDYFSSCLPILCHDTALIERVRLMVQSILTKRSSLFETEYRDVSGLQTRWYRLRLAPMFSGRRACVVITHEDISRTKHLAVDLQRSQEYLRAIFETTPDPVFVKDEQGRYIMANRSMAGMFGLEPAEIVGRTDLELFRERGMSEEEYRAFNEQDRKVLETGEPLVIEQEPWTDHLGRRQFFRTSLIPIRFSHCPSSVLGICTNITAERESREKLRNSELLLRTILDAVHYRILLLDEHMQVIWVNKAVTDDSGELLADLKGKNCRELCNPFHRCLACPAEQTLKTGEMHFSEIRTEKGVTFEVSSIPVRDAEGKVTSVVYIAEDVSQRLSFEQQLRQAQKMESLGVLAGGIAHDFNNILTAVLGFTEIALRKARQDESLSSDLQEVYQASVRARDLVNQILTFSRRIEKELQPLDISIIIREALKLLRATLPATLQMDFHVDRNLGPVLADPTQIHQVVINLCTNAAHAMQKEGGVLTISLRQIALDREQAARFHDLAAGQYIEFTVKDTGHGIPEEILPSIFDPYFTTKDLGEGTGLGLSVVHGIVKEYGGDITVRSQVGKGATFTLLFPVAGQDQVESERIRQEEPVEPGTGQRILVVDDEPAILRLCRRMLESAGYAVETEADPSKALEMIRQSPQRIDLLISDQIMPHLTGEKLVKAAHETRADLPVILMSGNKTTLSALEGNGERVRVVAKPINLGQLLTEIGRLLPRRP